MTETSPDTIPTIRFDPMVGISDEDLARCGGVRVTLENLPSGDLDPLRFVESRPQPCAATRVLFVGIQSCELAHHNNSLAHRMTNPDGSVTTWRA